MLAEGRNGEQGGGERAWQGPERGLLLLRHSDLGSGGSPPRRRRSEQSPALPPSVSTGRSCLLHLAWLMNKPQASPALEAAGLGAWLLQQAPLVTRADLPGGLQWGWKGHGKNEGIVGF